MGRNQENWEQNQNEKILHSKYLYDFKLMKNTDNLLKTNDMQTCNKSPKILII